MARANDFTRTYRAARRRAAAWDAFHPHAISADYRAKERRIHIELSNGVLFGFPVDQVQGLAGASDAQLTRVRVSASGHGLNWPALDADILLEPLMRGVLGTSEWMRELGRKGGSVRSKPKAAAARINGAKGGRPRRSEQADR
jgi:hypothetical protein